MTSPLITSFFTTLAQVSFTVSGLLAIAIAGDSKKRDYWFGHEFHSLYVQISFLLLLLPGFVSIAGLITISSKINIPFWPFAAFTLGLIYSLLAISFFFRRKRLADPEEFRRLENKFFKVIPEMGIYGIILIFLGIFGLSAYYSSAEALFDQIQMWLGIMLIFSVLSAAGNSITLLRANELPVKAKEEMTTITAFESSVGGNRKADSRYLHYHCLAYRDIFICRRSVYEE